MRKKHFALETRRDSMEGVSFQTHAFIFAFVGKIIIIIIIKSIYVYLIYHRCGSLVPSSHFHTDLGICSCESLSCKGYLTYYKVLSFSALIRKSTVKEVQENILGFAEYS